jgi:two-component system phosphate regulon response regulator PhoB
VRSIVYRFDDLAAFVRLMGHVDQELTIPQGVQIADNEWVLAVFELSGGRTTAAAARSVDRGGSNFVLTFERRDWERLARFAAGTSGGVPIAQAEEPAPESIPISVESVRIEPSAPPSSSRTPTKRRPHTGTLRSPGSGAAGPAKVLLVDDDRDIRQVVGAMLDAVGLKVESAQSAEEALERVRTRGYDLVVLDWNLPGMTGIELCRLIRKEPALMHLPVLFLTAHASSQDIVEAFASGADDYVVKPFRAPELGARIFGLLRRVRPASPA